MLRSDWITALFMPTPSMVPSPSSGLAPVLHLVVRAACPGTLIDLGTWQGSSFLAALDAAQAAGHALDAAAISTWDGQAPDTFYDGDAALAVIQQHIARACAPNGTLTARTLRARPEDAAAGFEDASIDLLLLGETREPGALRAQIETWRAKLSNRAVLLLHGISVEGSDAGQVYRDLEAEFPALSFAHSGGLAIVLIGPEQSEGMHTLAEFAKTDAEGVEQLRLLARIAADAYPHADSTGTSTSLGALRGQLDATLAETASRQEQVLAEQERVLAEQERALAEQERALAEQERAQTLQATLEAERDASRVEITNLQIQLSQLEEKRQTAHGAIAALLGSKSWKLAKAAPGLKRRITIAHDALQGGVPVPVPVPVPAATQESTGQKASLSVDVIADWLQANAMRPGNWVDPKVLARFQKRGFNVTANTFYAPSIDLNEIAPDAWHPGKYATAFADAPVNHTAGMFEKFASAAEALADRPFNRPEAEGDFFWYNEMFSPLDAVSYAGMIRTFKPPRVLEVGSGNSTWIALNAAEAVGGSRISCIEPYPSEFLKSQHDRLEALHISKVQDVDLDLFSGLEAGDFFFIDSSHCMALGSDLNFLMFEALPRIKPGVFVHFHDIFLPNEYPEVWARDVGIMWNEQYILLAFLMHNSDFEIVWSSAVGGTQYRADAQTLLRKALGDGPQAQPFLDVCAGGSLWLRKKLPEETKSGEQGT